MGLYTIYEYKIGNIHVRRKKKEIFEAFQDIFKEKLQCELHLQDVSYLRGDIFSYNFGMLVAYMLHKRYLGDPFFKIDCIYT